MCINPVNPASWGIIASLLTYNVKGANWAQLAGKKRQHVATPYIPINHQYRDASSVPRPMWSGRWGHAVTVFNQTSYFLNDMTLEEHVQQQVDKAPQMVLLGGDDYGYDEGDDSFTDDDSTNITDFHDHELSGGFRNDVWVSEISPNRSLWSYDERFKPHGTRLNDKTVWSTMKWHQSNPGYKAPKVWPPNHPKFGQPMPYDEWITCQDYFKTHDRDELLCDVLESNYAREVMWSPRRGHAATVANDALYVIGGRAREIVDRKDARIVGGASAIDSPSIHELSILKNDVWVSPDGIGKEWKLVTPGCKDQQEDILLQTELWSANMNYDDRSQSSDGPYGSKCKRSSDCFGHAECKKLHNSSYKVCVCPMFGVREHHGVAVQRRTFKGESNKTVSQDYIYVVGGFTNVRQGFCNDKACGSQGSYRVALDDVWVSNDAFSWVQIKPAHVSDGNLFRGRGSHATVLIQSNTLSSSSMHDRLWIFGGETFHPKSEGVKYLNDIWTLDLVSEPCCRWHDNCTTVPKPLEMDDIGLCLPLPSNLTLQVNHADWSERSGHTIIHEAPSLRNGMNDRIYMIGGRNQYKVFDDIWTCTVHVNGTSVWQQDFAGIQMSEVGNEGLSYSSVKHAPYHYYLDKTSALSSMRRSYQPLETNVSTDGHAYMLSRPLLRENETEELERLGIHTMDDFSKVDLYKMLELRDKVPNICYTKTLVHQVLQKCQLRDSYTPTDEMAPVSQGDKLLESCEGRGKIDRDFCIAQGWDGCSPIPGYESINVHGLGNRTVPGEYHNVSRDLEEMHCRQLPGERLYAAGQFILGTLYLLGGQGRHEKALHQDVWSRSDVFPEANITTRPQSYTTQSKFTFGSDIDGSLQFQYKLLDVSEHQEVTPWLATTVGDEVDVSWLDRKKGGPGSGWYTMYVRAITPSGNRDFTFSNSSNVHTWYYVQPLPWGLISGGIVMFVILISASYFEYRRRERKAALERYMARRRRRKFKLQVMNDNNTRRKNTYEHEKYKNASRIMMQRENDEENQARHRSSKHGLYQRSKSHGKKRDPLDPRKTYYVENQDLVSRIHTIQSMQREEEARRKKRKSHRRKTKKPKSNVKIKPV